MHKNKITKPQQLLQQLLQNFEFILLFYFLFSLFRYDMFMCEVFTISNEIQNLYHKNFILLILISVFFFSLPEVVSYEL